MGNILTDFHHYVQLIKCCGYQLHIMNHMDKYNNQKNNHIVLMKYEIPIMYKIDKYVQIQNFIYLKNQKCAIFYKGFCLIVDLNKKRNDKEIFFQVSPNLFKVFPVGQSIGYLEYINNVCYCYLIDQNGNVTKIKQIQSKILLIHLISFYSSQTVFAKLSLWKEEKFVQVSIQKQIIVYIQFEECHTWKKANDSDTIFTQIYERQRKLFNFKQNKQYTKHLPKYPYSQGDEDNPFGDIFLINQEQGIFATKNKFNAVVVGIVKFGYEGSYETILTYPEYDKYQFLMENKELQTVAIGLSQQKKGTSQLPVQSLVLFNYKYKSEVLKIQSKNYFFPPNNFIVDPSKISQNFDYFIFRVLNLQKITYYRPVDVRKLYMHLTKKSKILKDYGNSLIEKLLKVVY